MQREELSIYRFYIYFSSERRVYLISCRLSRIFVELTFIARIPTQSILFTLLTP